MDSLRILWTQMFNENNFATVKDEPEDLKPLIMLFLTIQQEFKKVEKSVENRINALKSSHSIQKKIQKITESPPRVLQETQEQKSPVFDKHRKRKEKRFKSMSKLKITEKFSTSNENENGNLSDDVLDSSVIDATPTSKQLARARSLRPSLKSSSLSKAFHGSTSTSKCSKINVAQSTQKIPGDIRAYFAANLSPCFDEDYDKVPEVEKPADEKPKVVRGKERLKLRGWSCKDCEKFYKGMSLSPEELEKKMNECSKHRSKFQPHDTFDGFWNLSIPVKSAPITKREKSPDLSNASILNKSTVYF